jgi:hypothetical protein
MMALIWRALISSVEEHLNIRTDWPSIRAIFIRDELLDRNVHGDKEIRQGRRFGTAHVDRATGEAISMKLDLYAEFIELILLNLRGA